MKRVLSIDGGGIRGIIPAMVLAEVEDRCGKPIAELFDLIAGTSTGGLLALGLTKPAPGGGPAFGASELVKLYETRGNDIFHRSPWHRITALGNILEEKWSSEPIERVLETYFGSVCLSDALAEVLVTAYDIEQRETYFFKRHKALADPKHDWPMRSVARATSAAPTYFEPAQLTQPGRDPITLVDGGVFANNPAMCGYVEARKLWPEDDEVVVLSLGTGEQIRAIPYDEARTWGLAKWAQPLLGIVFDGVSDAVHHQLQRLCNDETSPVGDNYLRFQVRLEKGNDDMDDASAANIRALKLHARTMLSEKESDLAELCKRLNA